jgi:hypothetical protein
MATNPIDPIEEDIEEALADPEFRAWLEADLAREDRGEPGPTYSTEEVREYLAERRHRPSSGM